MGVSDLILAAGAGMVCLAISATLWALVSRRRNAASLIAANERLRHVEYAAAAALASAEAGGSALIAYDRGRLSLTSREDALASVALILNCGPDPQEVVEVIALLDPDYRRKLDGLFALGQAFTFTAGQERRLRV